MKKTKKFFINAILLSATGILIRLVGVSFNAFISVKVGAECMGLFTLVMSVYGLAVTFATSGVNLAVVKSISEADAETDDIQKKNGKFRSLMAASVLYSLLFGVLTGGAVYAFSDFIGQKLLCDVRTVPSLRAFALSLPPIAVCSAVSGYFTGVRRVVKNAAVSLAEQFVKIFIICSGMVLIAPRGIESACLAIVGGGALAEGASLILSLILYFTDGNIKARHSEKERDEKNSKGTLRKAFLKISSLGLPVAVGAYARQGLLTAEHLAIPFGLRKYGLDPSGALAAYGVMQGMVMPLVLFPSAVLYSFAGLLVPELSECSALGNKKRVLAIGEKVFRSSLLFSVCVAGIFLSFSDVIGMTMYRSEEAARQLRLISALVPVMYLDSAVDGMLKGLGEQVYCMKVNVADSFLCLVLVFLLVPAFGIDGYIALLIISEIVNASFSIARLIKVTGLRINYVKWALYPVLSVIGGAFAAKAVCGLFPVFGGMSFSVTLCVLFYAIFCILLGAVKKEDVLWFKALASKEESSKTCRKQILKKSKTALQ